MSMSEFATLEYFRLHDAGGELSRAVHRRPSKTRGPDFHSGRRVSLAMLGGRSALPMLPVIVCMLAARSVLGCMANRTARRQLSCAALFWGGLAAGGGVAFLFDYTEFLDQIRNSIQTVLGNRASQVTRGAAVSAIGIRRRGRWICN